MYRTHTCGQLRIENAGETQLTVKNKTTGEEIPVLCELTGRTKDIILAGGLLDYTRESLK